MLCHILVTQSTFRKFHHPRNETKDSEGTEGKEHNITTLQHFPGNNLLQVHVKGLSQSSSLNNGPYSQGTKGCCHIIPLWEGTS